jgi:hypothetical protein
MASLGGAESAAESAAGDSLRIPGTITQVSYLGGGYRCEIKTECGQFFIDHPSAVRTGDTATVNIPVPALHIFPRDPARNSRPPS